MTLDQLAAATGLNKGFLSRIENDAKAPSIATVVKLSRALDVPVALLFGEQVADAEIHLVRAGKHAPAPSEPAGGYAFVPLSPPGEARRSEAFLMYPPQRFADTGHSEHSGEESLYVIEGRIEVKFADRSVAMATGDFLQFPGHLIHQVRRVGGQASVLIVISRD